MFQGVVEFSLCLFFAKLVSYTFLYWLPTFILSTSSKWRDDYDDSRVFFPVFVARQVQMPVTLYALFPLSPRYFGRRSEKLKSAGRLGDADQLDALHRNVVLY